MPSRVWSHICNYATMDGLGRVSIIEDYTILNPAPIPFIVPSIYIVSKWTGTENESYLYRIQIKSPAGVIVGKTPDQKLTIRKRNTQIEPFDVSLINMGMVQFQEFGEYSVEFFVDNNLVHIMPLIASRPIKTKSDGGRE